MNATALAVLGQHAIAYARCYVALTEALMREGVPEDIARREARATAAMAALMPEGKVCGVCGK